MDVGGRIELRNFAEVGKKLDELPRAVQGRIARPALRASAKLIQAAALSRAPRRTGLLARSIKVRAMKRSRTRVAGALVTTNEGSFAPKGKAFYAYFQELGWHIGKRTAALRRAYAAANRKKEKVRIENRRPIEGKHFLQQGFDASQGAAGELIVAQIAAGIETALKP